MNEKEIYERLVSLSSNYSRKKIESLNISSLCFKLASFQITEKTFKEISFDDYEIEFYNFFEGYYPKKILKNGQYLAQLNRLLETFPNNNHSAYKKIMQAIYSTSKYLSHFSSIEDFEKNVKDECKDVESTLSFLSNFRNISHLQNMYFIKTCKFFSTTNILDIPIPDKKAKKILLPLLNIEDDNKKIYLAMIKIAKSNNISLHELNERISYIDQDN